MRFLPLILAIISLGLVSCSRSKPPYCAVDTLSNVSNTTDSISDLKEKEESKEDTKSLSEFRSVIATLNSDRDPLVHASFFLYDITNDGKEDLWIKSGRCEGDYQFRAYSMKSGNPHKIYEGDGGHSDFFIYDGQLVCVMCNTGAGGVITYRYDGKSHEITQVQMLITGDATDNQGVTIKSSSFFRVFYPLETSV